MKKYSASIFRCAAALVLAPATALSLDDRSKMMTYSAKSEGGTLRTLGDAVVVDVTDTHVVVVSRTTGDALLVPLLMAWKHPQLSSRAKNEIKQAMEALVASGRRLEDGWNGKNVIYVEKSRYRPVPLARAPLGTSSSDAEESDARHSVFGERGPLPSGHWQADPDDAQVQMNRQIHDQHLNAMRMNQDAMRQHNRMVEDLRQGTDPTGMREAERLAEDSNTRMQRQAADAHLGAIRGMNDSMRHSGMGSAAIPEPIVPMPGTTFP